MFRNYVNVQRPQRTHSGCGHFVIRSEGASERSSRRLSPQEGPRDAGTEIANEAGNIADDHRLAKPAILATIEVLASRLRLAVGSWRVQTPPAYRGARGGCCGVAAAGSACR